VPSLYIYNVPTQKTYTKYHINLNPLFVLIIKLMSVKTNFLLHFDFYINRFYYITYIYNFSIKNLHYHTIIFPFESYKSNYRHIFY